MREVERREARQWRPRWVCLSGSFLGGVKHVGVTRWSAVYQSSSGAGEGQRSSRSQGGGRQVFDCLCGVCVCVSCLLCLWPVSGLLSLVSRRRADRFPDELKQLFCAVQHKGVLEEW